MTSAINIATASLIANQTALETIGNNIANVNTPGYSRQRLDIAETASLIRGGMSFGTGVQVSGLTRLVDQYAISNLRNMQSRFSEQDTLQMSASQLEVLLSQPGLSIDKGLLGFFEGLQQANNNPEHSASRETFFSQAQGLVERFHSMQSQLANIQSAINSKMGATTTQINAYAKTIASLNDQIASSLSNPSPELLDQRDNAVVALAELVDIRLTPQQDGTITVAIGNGQNLVVGGHSHDLGVIRSQSDPTQFSVMLLTGNAQLDITQNMSGGKLGGLLQFQNSMLVPAQQQLGIIALGISDSMNAQHRLGVNGDGKLGGDFFSDINTVIAQEARVIQNHRNTGSLKMSIQIDDTSALQVSDYKMIKTGESEYTVIRMSDDHATRYSGFPIELDGFTLSNDAGDANVGDSFILSPTRNASMNIQLEVFSGKDIALASPIITSMPKSNTGTGVISSGYAVDTSNPAFSVSQQLSPPVRLEFLSANSFQLVNASTNDVMESPISYTPGAANSIFPTPGNYDPGYRITITGEPAAGDTFAVNYNATGQGDNRNGMQLSSLQDTKHLVGGHSTFSEVYANLIGSVGTQNNRASIGRDVSQIMLQQSQAEVDSASGVNLDEEAADLLRYQEAYQASSKVIQISMSIMDILLKSLG